MTEDTPNDAGEQQDDKRPETEYAIVIDGELAVLPHEEVSYEEAVEIAYPGASNEDINYTVTFKNAESPRESGTLVAGELIKVKITGTVLDVTPTGKS